ncbi:MarR family winged helix-turn-helix transcriptional regulator [Streptomyces sp. NPDC051956]|uniref:MarR family winged helix-turn-helix transcriptional regulator n=1 Tax=Streptomyces sp. NPDC051956 TaxID=3365677 RepID=UPI0037D03B9F
MQAQNGEQAAAVVPLNGEEERLWRLLQRLQVALPRALAEDLLRSTGLSLSEYTVLAHLSGAPGGRLRMADLAAATALSSSRITRLVGTLQSAGHVTKQRLDADARGSVAVLTDAGRQRLRGAYPAHLASAHSRVIDRLDPAALECLTAQLQSVAGRLCPVQSMARESGA